MSISRPDCESAAAGAGPPSRWAAITPLKSSLVWAGLVLGAGFGGLADGIVLHSILGWHHLICAGASIDCQPVSIDQLKRENTQDGYFDLALWLVLMVGTIMLARTAGRAGLTGNGRILFGAMLAGSGLFNFLEGLINHQILGLHHVLPGSPHQFLFDMLYLATGALCFLIGGWCIRSAR